MGNVLVLGAGSVVRPFVSYLLEKSNCHVTVASRTLEKAKALFSPYPQAEILALDVSDTRALQRLIQDTEPDLVASFVPPAFDVEIAKLCVQNHKLMLTTSYASAELMSLDSQAKDAGVLIMTEIGLDPGIDHMVAMKVIHRYHAQNGKITQFQSVCGAIPAPEHSLNPFGYKFSWFPRGALSAVKRPAKYLKDDQEVVVPPDGVLASYSLQHIEGLGDFEKYPNMDCLPYAKTYDIPEVRTIYRGTLRYLGWCETLNCFKKLGLLDERTKRYLKGVSYRQLLAETTQCPESFQLEDHLVAAYHIPRDSAVLKRLEWLGWLSETPVPLKMGSPFDVLLACMLEKMSYGERERDMIVLQDEFTVEYPNGRPMETITATLIDYGVAGVDSAVARTVGLPAAIAARLILDGKIALAGVHLPVDPLVYETVLEELKDQGIEVKEKIEPDAAADP